MLSVVCIGSNALTWAQGVVGQGRVATFDGQGANAWSGNIRASDDELVALLEDVHQAIADVQEPCRSTGQVRRHPASARMSPRRPAPCG